MKNFYIILGLYLLITIMPLYNINSYASNFQFDTIADLKNNIPLTNRYFKTTEQAITAFNNARSQDFTIPTSQKNLVLPPNFEQLSWQDQYFVILNRERISRGLLTLTYPIQNLNNIAQNYSKLLIDNNQFTHTFNNTTPISRMQVDPTINNCMEFHKYGESLYYFRYIGFKFVTPKLVVLQGLYNFLYNDASSNWGHRKHLLSNFNNNNRTKNHEGHSGLGLVEKKQSNGYTAFVFTHNTFDPNQKCSL